MAHQERGNQVIGVNPWIFYREGDLPNTPNPSANLVGSRKGEPVSGFRMGKPVKVMRAKLFFKASFFVLFVLLCSCGAYASVEFPPTVSHFVKSDTKDTSSPFFNNLQPHTSGHGLVKTFTVKVNTGKIRKSYKSRTDQILPSVEIATKYSGEDFLFPVSGEISSLFGKRKHPFLHYTHFHTGIDIRAKNGTPIWSAIPGKVVYAGWRSGYGLTLEIAHGNGISTIYAHCSKLLVNVGQSVTRGAQVALVGRTGATTGFHLHFEVKRGSMSVNPLQYLKR